MTKLGLRTHCKVCNTELIFGINTVMNGATRIQSRCRDCWNEYYKERNKANYDPVKNRDRQLRKKFGVTLEEYQKLFQDQDGKCASCGIRSDKTLHVDHNHETGDIRGLLCARCNHVIGLVGEDFNIIYKIYEYLSRTTWDND